MILNLKTCKLNFAKVDERKFKFIKTIEGCDLFQYYLKDEVVIL